MSYRDKHRLESVRVLGVPVDIVDTDTTLAAIDTMLNERAAAHILTVNPEFIVLARKDPRFARLLERGDLSTIDGVGIVLVLRFFRGIRASRVTGADLLPEVARLAARRHVPIFLLGAGPGIAETVAERLQAQSPTLQVVGTLSGSAESSEEGRLRDIIRGSGARLLLVAFGTPKQEYWIARNLPHLGPCVAIGVGGAFDYVAGVVPRAPIWMRRAGLEWLYRLVWQPSRWRRQLALLIFLYLAVRERPREGRGRKATHG